MPNQKHIFHLAIEMIRFNPRNARGVSLLELIVALAIISLASLALFQSMSVWMRMSASTADAAETAITNAIALERFQILVRGMSVAWPEEETAIFQGSASSFSGLTSSPLHFADPGLEQVNLTIANRNGGSALIYEAGREVWTLVSTEPGTRLGFEYLGADGQWRQSWPPRELPLIFPQDDPSLFQMPQLPRAIKLYTEGQQQTVWIADIGSDPILPLRPQDVTGTLDNGIF